MTEPYTHPAPVTPVPQLRTPILSQTISELHLAPDAPYPSQALQDHIARKAMVDDINRFRRSQEHVVLKGVK